MIHPRSFLLLHNSDKSREEQRKIVQISAGQKKTKQNRHNRAEQGKGYAVQGSAFDG